MLTPPMPPPRKSHRLRNWLVGSSLAIAALIAGIAGCAAMVGSALTSAASPNSISSGHATAPVSTHSGAANSPSPSGPVELRLGDQAPITQDGADAATVVISRRVISSQPADAYSDGPQNGYFVAVHIKVNTAASVSDGFDINPLDFYALSGRAHYDEGGGNAFEGPRSGAELNASTLNAGETASGWLLFDLPAPHGKIVYAPNLDGPPLAYWKF
jgi:hypothetical protein